MPWPTWSHECTVSHKTERNGHEICPYCGQRGKFEGWHHTTVEFMGAYARRFRLAPFGPHRKLADELIQPRVKMCQRCNGTGMLDVNNGESYSTCPVCKGDMGIFDGSPEELEELRQKVLAVFPEAEPGYQGTRKTEQKSTDGSGYTGGGFFRPNLQDRSLQAYKDWINHIMASIKGTSDDEGSMTEEEWENRWKEFWSKMDNASESQTKKDE